MQRVKKGDTVVVVAGRDKGKRGEVLRIASGGDNVVVAGINVRTKHIKPTQQSPQGGRVQREFPIHLSNVMLADPKSGEPTRVRIKTLESGQRVRVSVKSGEQLDS